MSRSGSFLPGTGVQKSRKGQIAPKHTPAREIRKRQRCPRCVTALARQASFLLSVLRHVCPASGLLEHRKKLHKKTALLSGFSGDNRVRTCDLPHVKRMLSQLSYNSNANDYNRSPRKWQVLL